MTTEPFVKRCAACGHDHTLATWRHLPLVGVQLFEHDDEATGSGFQASGRTDPNTLLFEQRNCPCGSTLNRPLARDDVGLFDLLAEIERRRLALARAPKKEDLR